VNVSCTSDVFGCAPPAAQRQLQLSHLVFQKTEDMTSVG